MVKSFTLSAVCGSDTHRAERTSANLKYPAPKKGSFGTFARSTPSSARARMPPILGRSISTLCAPGGPAAETNLLLGIVTIAITATWRSVFRPWRGSSETRRLAWSPMVPCAARRVHQESDDLLSRLGRHVRFRNIFRRRSATRRARPHVGSVASFQVGLQVPVPSWRVRWASVLPPAVRSVLPV